MDAGDFDFEYLVLEDASDDKKKTKTIDVLSRRHGDLLGRIKWYSSWRQYTFVPEPGTVYSAGCLADVQTAITALMDDRKSARAGD